MLLQNVLHEDHFLIDARHGNYPDYDGQLQVLRMKDGKCYTTGNFVTYQLKSREQLKNKQFRCPKDVIEELAACNHPAILFIAEKGTSAVYWYYFDNHETKKALANGNNWKINLSGKEVTRETSGVLRDVLDNLAESMKPKKKEVIVDKLVKEFGKNVSKSIGLLFALRATQKKISASLFSKILDISNDEASFVLDKLANEKIILATHNYYLLDEEEIGSKYLAEIVGEIDLESVVKELKTKEDTMRFLSQLAKLESKKVDKFFEKIAHEVLSSLKKAKSNDERRFFVEYFDAFDFRASGKAIETVKWLFSAKPLAIKTHKTEIGPMKGIEHSYVLKKAIGVLRDIRFLQTRKVLDQLVTLASKNAEMQDEAMKLIAEMAKYDRSALKHIGFKMQRELIKELHSWSSKKIQRHLNIVLQICKEILDAFCEGIEMKDYKTFTIQQSTLKGSESLKKIRKDVINLLIAIFEESATLSEKLRILKALEDATRTPIQLYDKSLEDLIAEDTKLIIDWYIKILPRIDDVLVKEIDEQKEWFIQRYTHNRLPNLLQLEKKIANRSGFEYFRILIGDDHGFSRKMQYGEIEEFRKKKIAQFIDRINKKTTNEWIRRIVSIASISKLESSGSFNHFRYFLHQFSIRHPQLSHKLLIQHEDELQAFLLPLLSGLCLSEQKEDGLKIILDWIKTGKHLTEAAHGLNCFDQIDREAIKQIVTKAKKKDDVEILRGVLTSISKKFKGEQYLKNLFVDCVKELTKRKDTRTVEGAWFHSKALLQALNDKDADAIIKNLVLVSNFNHEAEWTLKIIAERYPIKIIHFFEQRVSEEKKHGISFSYEAIPYDDMRDLSEILRSHKEVVLPAMLDWFKRSDWYFSHNASKLILTIFDLDKVEKELRKLLSSKKKSNTEIVLYLIKEAGRRALVSDISKEFIQRHYSDKKYMSIIMASMSETGVVTGEDGLLHAYESKRDKMIEWQKDSRINVQKFAKDYEKSLNESIRHEKMRIEEELALLKRGIDR